MEAVTTDGTTWMASGAAQTGLGSAWHTATPTVGTSWVCEVGNRADSTTCDRNGPTAPVSGLATDGLGSWVAVGSGAADNLSTPCKPAAGAWRAFTADLSTWLGSTLNGGTAACTNRSEYGIDVATDPDGVWLATGNSGSRVWRTTDGGTAWGAAGSLSSNGRAVATDQEGLWLVATSSSIFRSTNVTSSTVKWTQSTSKPVGASLSTPINDVAFDQMLPMG